MLAGNGAAYTSDLVDWSVVCAVARLLASDVASPQQGLKYTVLEHLILRILAEHYGGTFSKEAGHVGTKTSSVSANALAMSMTIIGV